MSNSKKTVAVLDNTTERLQSENDNLRMQVQYLRGLVEENKFIFNTLNQNPNSTYTQIQHMVIQKRNDEPKLQREQDHFAFEQQQAQIQQQKYEELKKRTIEKYPHIEKKFEMQKKELEKEFEDITQTIHKFFDMINEELSEFLSEINDITENPIKFGIEHDPSMKPQSYRCLCCHTPFFTHGQITTHLHRNRNTHEGHTISQLREFIDKEISKANAEMQSGIEELVES